MISRDSCVITLYHNVGIYCSYVRIFVSLLTFEILHENFGFVLVVAMLDPLPKKSVLTYILKHDISGDLKSVQKYIVLKSPFFVKCVWYVRGTGGVFTQCI